MLLEEKVTNPFLTPVGLYTGAEIGVEGSDSVANALDEMFFRLLEDSFQVFVPDEFVVWLDQVPERLHYWANGIGPGDLID